MATCFNAQWDATARQASVAACGVTDAGGAASVNQDAFFVRRDEESNVLVLGVFDGHGKETGQRVAQTAKSFFEEQFQSYAPSDYAELERAPRVVFRRLYAACHERIKAVLREFYEASGAIVYEQPEGFLVKQDLRTHVFANVRGGTTATVVVILDGGRKIIASNVGDSTAMLGASRSVLSDDDIKICGRRGSTPVDGSKENLSSHEETEEEEEDVVDEIYDACVQIPQCPSSVEDDVDGQRILTNLLALTGDHSAECATEFLRARNARCSEEDPSLPELRFLYDTCSLRGRRLPIFSLGGKGELRHNFPGDYYKNVRDEWATVVATPVSSLFPDALAFTRSLGDLHMHAYGVCCDPTVVELSLEQVAARMTGHNNAAADNQSDSHRTPTTPVEKRSDRDSAQFTLLLATDGVWDNWKYGELFQWLRDARTQGKRSGADAEDAIERVAASLMQANLTRAETTFGDQADNMTAIVCHVQVT